MKTKYVKAVVAGTLAVVVCAIVVWALWIPGGYSVSEYPSRITGKWVLEGPDKGGGIKVWVLKADASGEIWNYERTPGNDEPKVEDFSFFYKPWETTVYRRKSNAGEPMDCAITNWRVQGRELMAVIEVADRASVTTLPLKYTIKRLSETEMLLVGVASAPVVGHKYLLSRKKGER